DNGAASSVISAGLAEIDGLFRPSKHKQTEHVEESKRKRIDVSNGAGIDLERGLAVIRPVAAGEGVAPSVRRTRPRRPERTRRVRDGRRHNTTEQPAADASQPLASDPAPHLDTATPQHLDTATPQDSAVMPQQLDD